MRGELLGNLSRAANSAGQPLLTRDQNGDSLPDRATNGDVIIDPNGLPFNEDVTFNSCRQWGKKGTSPSQLAADGFLTGETYERDIRQAIRAEIQVPILDSCRGAAHS